MIPAVYLICAALVFVFSGLLAMAGLGAAFLFVPLFYYLGVPFILNYNFAQKRKTSFYISGGFSLEKGLIAKYKATPMDNFPGMEPIYSHNAIQGLQYSMFGGIGISYKFINHFELFGQPSMTYYLKSDGKNNTVYTVHPLIFNLRTGIRYTIR